MKNTLRLTVLSLILALISNSIFSQETSQHHNNVVEAVKHSIQSMVGSIPENMLPNYGIKNRDEINRALVGRPVEIYTIVKNEMIFTNTWRVPLLIDNQPVALFTVILDNNTNQYKTVNFGATILAREISNCNEKNDLFGMLRVYEIKKDFTIHSSSKGSYQFAPIPNETKQLYSLKEILNLIQQ